MTGVQAGAYGSGTAIPPLFGYGMGPETNLAAAMTLIEKCELPWGDAICAEEDLRFATSSTLQQRKNLGAFRKRTGGIFKELAGRLEPVSKHLRTF